MLTSVQHLPNGRRIEARTQFYPPIVEALLPRDAMPHFGEAAAKAADVWGHFDVFVSGRVRDDNGYLMTTRVDVRQNALIVCTAHMQNFANRISGLFAGGQQLPEGVRRFAEPQEFGGGVQIRPSFLGDFLRAAGQTVALGVDCIVEAVCRLLRAPLKLMDAIVK